MAIQDQRSDEIGRLASSFNQMVVSSKSLRDKDLDHSKALLTFNAELRRTNDNLKNEVAERQRAERKVLEQYQRIQLLHEINSAISSTLDRKILLDALFDKIESLLHYAAITVRLVDRASDRLVPISARNIDEDAWRKGLQGKDRLDRGVTEPGRAAKPCAVGNRKCSDRFPNFKSGAVSPARFNLLPCRADPYRRLGIGRVGIYSRERRHFAREEADFLTTLAGPVGVGIYNSELFEKIKNQAAELEKANKAKDEFLSVMSHELRTPLNVINGYTGILGGGVLGEVKQEQAHALKTINLQAKELLRMINEVLQVGSLEAGKVTVKVEESICQM